ncbi:MAG: TIGR01777 family oxidoreductase [Bacteroidetes bacterium]|nr:TIGR01777 family oxidoreductase [Bacteroidota bacterium]
MKKIVITGATGFIGKNISTELINRGDEVVVFSRSPERAKSIVPGAHAYVNWDYNSENNDGWIKYLEGADSVIHLAGESVMAKRWNEEHKKSVLESRVLGTRSLVEAVSKLKYKPNSFISASAIGYYGTSETEIFNEKSDSGNDFLARVTRKWEEEVVVNKYFGVREVRVRIGIVLDKKEGALAKMITPYKFFVGGPIGSGKQWFSWIHIKDVVGIFLHVLDNTKVSGPVNAVSPAQINMNQFSKILGRVLHRPALFKVPSVVIKLIVGEAEYLVTEGAKVLPKVALESGYNFVYTDLGNALSNIFKK